MTTDRDIVEYRVGDVWERDGRQRDIIAIRTGETGPFHKSTINLHVWEITWKRAFTNGAPRRCWCSTWLEWASKAKLVIR